MPAACVCVCMCVCVCVCVCGDGVWWYMLGVQYSLFDPPLYVLVFFYMASVYHTMDTSQASSGPEDLN